MHDTLANRGRINYSSYNQEEQVQIQKITTEFLDGQRDNIGEMDSLRKVREVFSQIRLVYRKMQQNNDAIRRQIDSNPEAFKTL
jgi:kinesin family protein 6/9